MALSNKEKILKVCKIESRSFGKFCVLNGIDFLGIHVLEESDMGKRLDIVNYLNSIQAKTIIVTKVKKLELIENIIKNYRPHGIQLHYNPDISLIDKLKNKYPNIKIFSVLTDEVELSLAEDALEKSDYIIYDTSYIGGTGLACNYTLLEQLNSSHRDKILLAGGIDVNRIKELMFQNCAGFDIQSYFRSGTDVYYNRLETVADLLQKKTFNISSVSLTSLPKESLIKIPKYVDLKNYEYHLDVTDGSLYPEFIVDREDFEYKLKYLSNKPLSVHVFSKHPILKQIEGLSSQFDKNITRFFVQYYPGLNIEELPNFYNDSKIVLSVHYSDLEEYMLLKHNRSFISVGLSSKEVNDVDLARKIKVLSENNELKEMWLDKDLTIARVKLFLEYLSNLNIVVGKEVVSDWDKLDMFYDLLS